MQNLKLYEITNGFMSLNNNEELTEEEKNEIGVQLTEALKTKSNNIVGYYQEEKVLLEGIDAEIKRLQDYRKAVTNRIDRYKEYVKENMQVLGIDKIETELGTISIAKSPISVDIIDEDKIPAEYKTIVQTIKVDKKAIADNFKSTGELIEGVRINTENKSLRIK
jgi:hypothetical protein